MQELMLFSGVAPLVREGDKLRSEFTLRNASERDMRVQAQACIRGVDDKPKVVDVRLAPGEAKEVGWDINVPTGVNPIIYEIEANEAGGAADRLRVSQKAIAAVPVRTYQATIKQVDPQFVLTVERPKDALVGRGGINILFRPKVADGLIGVTDTMRAYPYTCMEQLTSRAVSLRDPKLWRANMDILPSYLDSEGMVKFFPNLEKGSEILTTYLLAIAHEAGWEIPAAEKARMEVALGQFIQGKLIRRGALPTADLAIRKMAAMDALSRWNKADKAWLSLVAVDVNLWPTYAVIDWYNVLQRMKDIPNRERQLKQAEQVLRSRLNFQGTTLNFSTEKSDALWWLLTSADTNAVRLILSFLPAENWQADMPRFVQGVLLRQRRGTWDPTLANAWGVLAFEKFSQRFESAAVSWKQRRATRRAHRKARLGRGSERQNPFISLACG
jgi:alpha-2-macroglobulin